MALGPIKTKQQMAEEQAQRTRDAIARLNSGQARSGTIPSFGLPQDEIYKAVPVSGDQDIPVLPEIMSDPQSQVNRAIAESGSLDPAIAKMGPVAVPQRKYFNPATNSFTDDPAEIMELTGGVESGDFELSDRPEDKAAALEQELTTQSQQAVAIQPNTLELTPGASAEEGVVEIMSKPEMIGLTETNYIAPYLTPDRDSSDVRMDLNDAIRDGNRFNQALPQILNATLNSDGPTETKVKAALESAGAYDPATGALNNKLGQALVFAQALIANEMLDKENKLAIQRNKLGGNYDKAQTTEGAVIEADMARSRLAEEVINLIGENPNRLSKEVNVGFGGAGSRLDSETKSALTALFTQLLSDDGMYVKVPQPDGTDIIALSDAGQLFARSKLDLLIDMGLRGDIDTSSSPSLGGSTAPGRSMERGRRTTGDRSRKTNIDPNTAKVDLAKSILGSIPQKIIQDRFAMANLMVKQTISFDPQTGRISILDAEKNPDGGEYSTRAYASTLNLDKTRWYKAYQEALKTQDQSAALNQANLIMRQEARKILKIMNQGATKSGQVFYNKIFDADTVGRLFFRNTVLNTQDSKTLARMFVGNAIDVIINPNRDQSTDTMENFMYITGRNLLDADIDLNGRDVEDLGWNAILDATKTAFNSQRYSTWVQKGNKLKAMLAQLALDPQANIRGFSVNDPELADLFKEFTKKGEWGYKYQSYIDIANYDAALKSGKSFKAQAQTQHDGKQNGIAIQSVQLGNTELLSRTGLIFKDDKNVLPWGDVRELFGQRLYQGISYAVKQGGLTEEKKAFWDSIFVGENSKMGSNQMSPARRREILKALSKQPLMEISYGRFFLFNEETATDFVNDVEFLDGLLDTSSYTGGEYDTNDMINDLNLIIAGTVNATLNFKHQAAFKKAGKLSAMLGVPLGIRGPSGNMIYMGSTEQFKTGKTISVDTGIEVIELEMYEPRVTGSAKMGNLRKIKTPEGNWEIQQAGDFGQEVANQLPVLPIQQIDAAVMIQSLLDVNRAAVENKNAPLFVIPVHDAIITDASSVKKYHAAMNRNFVEMNKNYSLTKAIYTGLENTKALGLAKIKDSEMYQLNNDSIYRAVHNELANLAEAKASGTSRVLDEDGVESLTKQKLSLNNEELLRLATTGAGGYWNADGTGSISGVKLKEIINLMFKRDRIFTILTQLHKRAESERSDIFKKFNLDPAQYN